MISETIWYCTLSVEKQVSYMIFVCVYFTISNFPFCSELLEEDHNKRLLISVWHRDQTSSLSEFLGCMSFGVRHLLNPKKVSGSFTPIKSWDVNVVFVFYEFDLVWITPVKCSVCIWFIAFYIKKIFINTSGDNRMVLSANRRNRSQEASPGVKEKATAAT